MEKSRNKNRGQIMLLSIMILGGVMLSASMIAGLLLRHQIRQVNDAVSSAKAVFAADTGIELVSWCIIKGACAYDDPNLPNEVSFEDSSTVFNIRSVTITDTISIISEGTSSKTIRILEAVFASE